MGIKQIKLVEEPKWNFKYNVIAKNGTLFIRYDVEKCVWTLKGVCVCKTHTMSPRL